MRRSGASSSDASTSSIAAGPVAGRTDASARKPAAASAPQISASRIDARFAVRGLRQRLAPLRFAFRGEGHDVIGAQAMNAANAARSPVAAVAARRRHECLAHAPFRLERARLRQPVATRVDQRRPAGFGLVAVAHRDPAIDGSNDRAVGVEEGPAARRLSGVVGAALLANRLVGVRARLRIGETPVERPLRSILPGEAGLLLHEARGVELADRPHTVGARIRDLLDEHAAFGPEAIEIAAAQRPPAARLVERGQLRHPVGPDRAQPPVGEDRAPLAIVEDLDEKFARPIALAQTGRAGRHAAHADSFTAGPLGRVRGHDPVEATGHVRPLAGDVAVRVVDDERTVLDARREAHAREQRPVVAVEEAFAVARALGVLARDLPLAVAPRSTPPPRGPSPVDWAPARAPPGWIPGSRPRSAKDTPSPRPVVRLPPCSALPCPVAS